MHSDLPLPGSVGGTEGETKQPEEDVWQTAAMEMGEDKLRLTAGRRMLSRSSNVC